MSLLKKTSFLLIFLLVLLPFIGYALGGIYNFLAIVMLLTIVPIVDYLVQDSSNPDTKQEQQLKKDSY